MPPIIAGVAAAASGAAAAFAAAPFLVQLGIRAVAGFIISGISATLLGKSKATTEDNLRINTGRQQSLRQAAAPRQTVYGESRVGGIIVYVESDDTNNNWLSLLVAVSGREIAGFEEYFFGDERLSVSGNDVGGRYSGVAYIYPHLGTDSQTADTVLVAASAGKWTTAHRLRGIAYWHARLEWEIHGESQFNDYDLNSNRVRIRGALCYDPRDLGTRYTHNVALIIRDYLVNRLGVTAAELNDTAIIAAANTCDEQVTLAATTQTFTASASTDQITLTAVLGNLRRGNVVRVASTVSLPTGLAAATDYYLVPQAGENVYGLASSFANAMAGTLIDLTSAGSGTMTLTLRSEPRYTAHGVVLDSDHPGSVLKGLADAMAGAVSYFGGKWSVFAGVSGTAALTLDEDDLRGPITIQPRRSRADLYNAVKPIYRDPDQQYQSVAAPALTNATYETQDGGDRIWQDMDLPFTDSPTRAQRLGRISLERCRQQIAVDYPAKLTALGLQVWDVVNVTNTNFGWSSKAFRVVGISIADDQGLHLRLVEEATTMWDWSAEETTVDPAPDTNLPSFRTVGAPGAITTTEELRQTSVGTIITTIIATTTESNDAFVRRYEWQWKRNDEADSAYRSSVGGLARLEIPGVLDNLAYAVRVRAVNTLGFSSSWVTATYTTTGLSAYRAPSAPPKPIIFAETLRVTGGGTVVTVVAASVTAATPDYPTVIGADASLFALQYAWEFAGADAVYHALPLTTQTSVELVGVVDGDLLTVRVRVRNFAGFLSSYTTGTYTPVGQSAQPDDVVGFSSNVIGHNVHLSWTAGTDIDLASYRIRYSPDLVSPSWASAVDACPMVAKPATSIVLPARTGTWLIKAVDMTGHESQTAATTGAAVATLDGLNFVATATESPTFAGSHSGTVASGGYLQLDTTGDSLGAWTTLGDIAAIGLGVGTIVGSGTYTFANGIDLGAVYTSRVTANITVTAEDFTNSLASWPDLGSVQQLGGNEQGNYDVVLQVRTTQTDPSGSPVWSAWRNFIVGDYTAWGFQFRAVLVSYFATVTPLVSALSVSVDMPDRIETGADVSIASGGTAVTYAQPYKVTPALAITTQNMGTGEYYEFTAKTSTGFTVRFKNAAGSNVGPRTIDWAAQGY